MLLLLLPELSITETTKEVVGVGVGVGLFPELLLPLSLLLQEETTMEKMNATTSRRNVKWAKAQIGWFFMMSRINQKAEK